jgi:hypothetical protein
VPLPSTVRCARSLKPLMAVPRGLPLRRRGAVWPSVGSGKFSSTSQIRNRSTWRTGTICRSSNKKLIRMFSSALSGTPDIGDQPCRAGPIGAAGRGPSRVRADIGAGDVNPNGRWAWDHPLPRSTAASATAWPRNHEPPRITAAFPPRQGSASLRGSHETTRSLRPFEPKAGNLGVLIRPATAPAQPATTAVVAG